MIAMVVVVGKQAANQAYVSNPHTPPGTTGRDSDTERLSPHVPHAVYRQRRRKLGQQEEEEKQGSQSGFGWRLGRERRWSRNFQIV